jgi:hypothetical protein
MRKSNPFIDSSFFTSYTLSVIARGILRYLPMRGMLRHRPEFTVQNQQQFKQVPNGENLPVLGLFLFRGAYTPERYTFLAESGKLPKLPGLSSESTYAKRTSQL